jgi:hypothetical protein
MDQGHQVGALARQLLDPAGGGTTFDVAEHGIPHILQQTPAALATHRPVFEAAFATAGVFSLADAMLPLSSPSAKAGRSPKTLAWQMVEVKAATSVKEHYVADASIQAFVARQAGVRVEQVALSHLTKGWRYAKAGDYQGLLTLADITTEVETLLPEVPKWVAEAQTMVAKRNSPHVATGAHCTSPYACPFLGHCTAEEGMSEATVSFLPSVQKKALRAHIEEQQIRDIENVPDALLNDLQLRVKQVHLSGKPYLNRRGARADLPPDTDVVYFMDFETISLAVPRFLGTTVYAQVPFQFSVYRAEKSSGGKGAGRWSLTEQGFLCLSGEDPRRRFAQALIAALKEHPDARVFVYNAGFERSCLTRLTDELPDLAEPLRAIAKRIVDLLPVTRDHYYHPAQKGSWSLKAVLPTLPGLPPGKRYDELEGVADGGAASAAYLEAIDPTTSPQRREQIAQELRDYCALDTEGLFYLWVELHGQQQR